MRVYNLLLLLIFCCGLTLGCDSGATFADKAADFEGVYEIDTYTLNEAACEDGGNSQVGENSPTHFVLYSSSFFGITFATATSCDNVEACKKTAEDPMSGSFAFSFTFDRSSSAGQMTGTERSTGFSSGDGICTKPRVSYNEITLEENESIKLIKDTHYGNDYPQDAEGYCTTDAGYEASKNSPCSERTTLMGRRVDSL